MRLLSVNIGTPRRVYWHGREVTTAIFKHPVDGPRYDRLLTMAGIRGEFDQLLTVDDADAWKPVPAAYAHAARGCPADIEQMLLVAVHPWDIHGAHQAGMRTGWISR